MDALIGYTGFVGQSLLAQCGFDSYFNSSNIEDIEGQKFDTTICAGVSAEKWRANQDPSGDAARIDRLKYFLQRFDTRRFILISTIDVYSITSGVDETSPTISDVSHPYGRHRGELEFWIQRRFMHSHIVRLPALFGNGLKKNALFDLMNNNRVELINPLSRFQWYPLRRLGGDLATIVRLEVPVVNLVTQPVAMEDIGKRFFRDSSLDGKMPPANYDIHSRYSRLFDGQEYYLMDSKAVFEEIGHYLGSRMAS